ERFKQDEPWDSDHNKKLLREMPPAYVPVGFEPKQPHSTSYHAVVGPGAAWELKPNAKLPFGAESMRIPASFPDGLTNTILVVETREAVPWTKPEDVRYEPKKKLPKLGGIYRDGFYVGMADGSYHFVRGTVSEATLRAALTRAGGEVLGNDWD